MSLSIGTVKIDKKEKEKEENGNPATNYEKKIIEEKEEDTSNLTNLKVFNGLIEEDNVFKNLNKNNNNNQNINNNKNLKNSKKDLDVYLNDNKMIDLNYISFGDCDNIFVNNISAKKIHEDKKNKKDSKIKEKKDKEKDKDKNSSHSKSKSKKSKHSHSKKHNSKNNNINNNLKNLKIQKKSVEELLTNDSNRRPKTMSFNEPKELSDDNNFVGTFGTQNDNREIIERKEKECQNFFKISAIKQGEALLVTGDDTVFTFPAYLLPVGAKLGESFTFEIKLFDNSYNKKEKEEIENIQKKYASEKNNNI